MATGDLTYTQALAFWEATYSNISRIKVVESRTFGTLDFTNWVALFEMVIEPDPGQTTLLVQKQRQTQQRHLFRGSYLLWWQWEGKGDNWKGDFNVESSWEVRGWKVVREHHHVVPLGNVKQRGKATDYDADDDT
jgi:hypothetical protein